MREWSCCKKTSHDFDSFLEIPGCKTGKHTTEKPASVSSPISTPAASSTTNAPSKESCSRCQQGFFCSDHGSQTRDTNLETSEPADSNVDVLGVSSTPLKKVVDINQPQTCKNKGCRKTFKKKYNHNTACSYHPGPTIFHDRIRGWTCCDIHVNEFDEFMTIPPCTKGWHDADV